MSMMEKYNIFSALITSDNASLESRIEDYKCMRGYFNNVLKNLEYYNNAYKKSLEILTNDLKRIKGFTDKDTLILDGVKRTNKMHKKNLGKFLRLLRIERLNDTIKLTQDNYNETSLSIEKYKKILSQINNTIYSCEILIVFYYMSRYSNISDDRMVEMVAVCDVDYSPSVPSSTEINYSP